MDPRGSILGLEHPINSNLCLALVSGPHLQFPSRQKRNYCTGNMPGTTLVTPKEAFASGGQATAGMDLKPSLNINLSYWNALNPIWDL